MIINILHILILVFIVALLAVGVAFGVLLIKDLVDDD